LAPLSYPVLL